MDGDKMGDYSGGSGKVPSFGSDGQSKLSGHDPKTGNSSCTGSKGQGHVKSSEGKSGS